MTVDGQTGTASRSFNVFNDGKLHVAITSPKVQNEPFDGKLVAVLDMGTAATLSAVSTSDAAGGMVYLWNITQKDATGVQKTLAALSGATTTFTPSGFLCGNTPSTINVNAVNPLGELAQDSVDATVPVLPPTIEKRLAIRILTLGFGGILAACSGDPHEDPDTGVAGANSAGAPGAGSGGDRGGAE